MNTQKHYIGSGRSTKFDGVVVTLRVAEASKFIRTTEDGEFLSFLVTQRKEMVEGKPTHNVFVMENAPAEQPKPAMASEPELPFETPKELKGRKVRKITKAEAAALRASATQA